MCVIAQTVPGNPQILCQTLTHHTNAGFRRLGAGDNRTTMKTPANKSPYLPLLIVGIAVILFSTAGVAAIMAWFPASIDDSGDTLAPDNLPLASAKRAAEAARTAPMQVTGDARAKERCAGCGVIVSTREIDARVESTGFDASGAAAAGKPTGIRMASTKRYETTIRLPDRSSRVIHHANPASWRPGERVIVIEGANRPDR